MRTETSTLVVLFVKDLELSFHLTVPFSKGHGKIIGSKGLVQLILLQVTSTTATGLKTKWKDKEFIPIMMEIDMRGNS